MKVRIICTVENFDPKKWGRPWVAVAEPKGGMYFYELIGGYKAGKVYINEVFLENGCVYAWGQKDYKGSESYVHYLQYQDGKLSEISKAEAKSLAKTNTHRRLVRKIKKIEDTEYQKRILAETYALPAAVVLENEYPHIVRRLYPEWGKELYNDVELARMVWECRQEAEKAEGE